jgi:DNA-binding transcriptional regulator LsrR (DeoR family)
MAETVTSDQLAAAARGFEKDQFTRAELADKLGVQVSDIKQAVKEAREAGRIDWIGENEEGKGLFRVIGE